jgi:RNA polymerase primary sigma factor
VRRRRVSTPSRAPASAEPSRNSATADSLHAYLREIARYSPLPSEEEKALGQRIRAGDGEALKRLVESNLRFVVAYAKRYRGLGLPFLDLIHEGNLGLIEAARRFDPERNVRFITYAVWWVRQAMLLALSEQSHALRLPQKVAGQVARVQNVRERLGAELEREPTAGEIARAVDLSEEEVAAVDRLSASDISLSAAIGDDGDLELEDALEQSTIPPVEVELMRATLVERMRHMVSGLDEKERLVLGLRYGLDGDEPRTLQEIGKRMGVTRERVRQIESRAKEKLRRMQAAQALRGCVN